MKTYYHCILEIAEAVGMANVQDPDEVVKRVKLMAIQNEGRMMLLHRQEARHKAMLSAITDTPQFYDMPDDVQALVREIQHLGDGE